MSRVSLVLVLLAVTSGGCTLFEKDCEDGFKLWEGNCYLSAEGALEQQGGALTPGSFSVQYTARFCQAIEDCGAQIACPDDLGYPAGCTFDRQAARDCLAGEWGCDENRFPVGPPACEQVFECEGYSEPYGYGTYGTYY